ncbi:MAG: hypothetical protein ACRDLV_10480 [Solirubrobacteraceae bacterium]
MTTTTEAPPTTQQQLDEARDRLRHEKLDRFAEQLTFDVGAGRGDAPDFASLKISGAIGVSADLKRRQGVIVRVMDARNGELICDATATVTSVQFKDATDKNGTTTERVHVAPLD